MWLIVIRTGETRSDTSKNWRILESGEVQVYCKITGKSLLAQTRSEAVRETCSIEGTNEWISRRKREENDHISGMPDVRLSRIARDKSPVGRRQIGRPRKRWSDCLEAGRDKSAK